MTGFPPIETLLAHRENMLLISAVTAFSTAAVTCRATPDPLAWYASDDAGRMPGWIGLELMAQAVAAHVALLAIDEGRPPRPGALLGTRNYQSATASFEAGNPLTIRASEVHRAPDGLASYECAIEAADGGTLARAALTVYEPADFKQFILGIQK